MAYKDYYAILGVPKNVDQAEIKRAYKKLARKYHPDVNKDPGAEERFKEIGEAYAVLSDQEKRHYYDQFGNEKGPPPPPPGGFQWQGNVDSSQYSDFFQELFGARGGASGLFGGLFGSRGSHGMSRRGRDIEAEINLSLELAYSGGEQRISLNGGTYSVRIPAGVRPGSRIRLAGQGESGHPPGNLYLVVRLLKHPVFRLEGADVYTTLDVPAPLAALGGEVRAPTLDGDVTLNLPPGTQSGRRIRLKGKGWPRKEGGRGDAYVVARVVVPQRLSPEEKRLYGELAALLKAGGVRR